MRLLCRVGPSKWRLGGSRTPLVVSGEGRQGTALRSISIINLLWKLTRSHSQLLHGKIQEKPQAPQCSWTPSTARVARACLDS